MCAINRIKNLKNKDGVTIDWDSDPENVMSSYFTKLFTASATEWSTVINCIHAKVTDELGVVSRYRRH